MFQLPAPSAIPHETASFWLDVADKAIKLAAVFIGGLWTWWNYRKSRTYEQRLELEVTGKVYSGETLHGDIKVTVKNIGATMHPVSHQGTICLVSAIYEDLSESRIRLFRVFQGDEKIEPGESINDTHCWRITSITDEVTWIKLTLRVVSDGVEWSSTRLIHVESRSCKVVE